jgi:predicted ATP-grasp superfamily ATP-dependent carboligase
MTLKITSAILLTGVIAGLAASFMNDATKDGAHSIHDTALASGEPLYVDVTVNQTCFPSIEVRTIADAIVLKPGQNNLEVRLATGACDGTLAIASTINLQPGQGANLTAHLSEVGIRG